MKYRLCGALFAASLALSMTGVSAQQRKPTLAIMPTQYFSASPESAQNLTQGLVSQFEGQGYTVLPMDKSTSTFQSMGLQPSQNYADRVAIKFGKQMGADIVAYPRLMALGIPATDSSVKVGGLLEPAAVVHLRVLNVHSRTPIYCRQVGHEFRTDVASSASGFTLPGPIASAAATDVTQDYFQRVAGSRQEFRGTHH